MPDHKRARQIGRLFQDPLKGTAPHMTIEENMALAYLRAAKRGGVFSTIRAKDRAAFRQQLAALGLGLEDRLSQPVGLLSGGQRQALTLLMATLVTPKLLLLDEPINGLDPVGIRQTRDLLVHLKEACGTTILISSHIISEIEQLADTVGVINKGRMLKEMPMEEIRREAVQYLEVHVNDVRKAAIALED